MTVHRTSNKAPKRQPVSRPADMKTGMDVLCVCGMRYGQHRYNGSACQNPDWRPGNGKPQWLSTTFRRAA